MAFDLQAHNMMIDQQAETSKAMAQVQLESQPFIAAPSGDRDMGQMIGPDGQPMGQPGMIPNPHYTPLDQSLIKNVAPIIAKYQPKELDNFITSAVSIPYRLAEAKRQEAMVANDATLAEQRQSSTALNLQKIEESKARQMKALMGDSYAPGPLQKDLDAIDKAPGLSDDEKDHAKRVRMALEPKQSPLKARASRSDYIEKHIEHYLEQNGGKREDALKVLGTEYDNLFPPEAAAAKRKGVLRYNPSTGKLE